MSQPISCPVFLSFKGPGLQVIGGLVIFGAIFSTLIHLRLLVSIQGLVEGKGVLAHWTYDRLDWIHFMEQELVREKKEKSDTPRPRLR